MTALRQKLLSALSERFGPFGSSTIELIESTLEDVKPVWEEMDFKASLNQLKVLHAFRECGILESDFSGTTGYGYGDRGRGKTEELFAKVFGAETGYVRLQVICGTHALAGALWGVMSPGKKLVSITGRPYDTFSSVLKGLEGWGVRFKVVDPWDRLLSGRGCAIRPEAWRTVPGFDEEIKDASAVLVQRSRGYDAHRPSLRIDEIGGAIAAVRQVNRDATVIVDNCYGEFVELREPSQVGADVVVGSLMKNPGGGLAPTGGYVVGARRAVDKIADALVAPGIGREAGPSLGLTRHVMQGLFLAPKVVAEAKKSAAFIARHFQLMGYEVEPSFDQERGDTVQTVRLGTPERIAAFCRAVQAASPVDSTSIPIPWEMPGYSDEVIMAAGAFIQGSSIEFSADAPMRPPYAVYVQGGLAKEQAILACALAREELADLAE